MRRIRGVVLAAVRRGAFTGAFAGALMGALTGCAPQVSSHGYAPDEALLADVAVGQDTRAAVAEKIGRPINVSTFDDDDWYYVTSTLEQHMYYAPKVVDRRIVAVHFDENDVVSDVRTYGVEDGRIIDLATQTTPTHGREMTILQQVLGNIGRITGEDLVGEE